MSFCKVQVAGNLGRDPETREVGESSVTSFSIAHNRKEKGDEVTDWFNVDAWGRLGEVCAEFLSKGSQVVVAGDLRPRSYEKDGAPRTSLDIRATDVHFLRGAVKQEPTEAVAPSDDDLAF